MKFLKVTYGKIFLAATLFAVAIIFFLPVKVNATCGIGKPCPQLTEFVRITEITKMPAFVSMNYLLVAVELIISYLLAAIALSLAGRGGLVNFIAKK